MNDPKWYGKVFLGIFALTAAVGIVLIVLTSVSINRGIQSAQEKNGFIIPRQVQYPKNTIAVLNIFSAISYTSEDGFLGRSAEGGTITWIDLLQSVEYNPNVKAVILRINSPGGTVAATQELYNQILRLKKSGKTVVVSMGDIAASGAYYIACAADYIIANPGTLTGSIGVIMANWDFSGLMKKFGVGYNVVKSGKNKDLFSSYRKMTDEETEVLKGVVMDTYDQFLKAVMKGRRMKQATLAPLADGRIFTGRQALKARLIDAVGDFEDAIDKTADLADIKGSPNVTELRQDNRSILKYLNMSVDGIAKRFGLRTNPVIGEIGRAGSTETPSGNNASPVFYLYRP